MRLFFFGSKFMCVCFPSFLLCPISCILLPFFFAFRVSEIYGGYFLANILQCVNSCHSGAFLTCLNRSKANIILYKRLHNSAMPMPGFNTVFNMPSSARPHDSEVDHPRHPSACFYRGRVCDWGPIFRERK